MWHSVEQAQQEPQRPKLSGIYLNRVRLLSLFDFSFHTCKRDRGSFCTSKDPPEARFENAKTPRSQCSRHGGESRVQVKGYPAARTITRAVVASSIVLSEFGDHGLPRHRPGIVRRGKPTTFVETRCVVF